MILYKNDLLKQIFNKQIKDVDASFYLTVINRYYNHLIDIPQYSAEYIITKMKKTQNYTLFIEEMNLLEDSILYKSEVHGEEHIIRVCIFAYYLAYLKKLPRNMIIDILEVAKYHDIGRINDKEDRDHGFRGAMLYGQYFTNKKSEKNMYGAIITAHSMRDEEFDMVWQQWNNPIEKLDYGKMIFNIIKDADALDRFRLNDCSLKTQFLHSKEALQLIRAAYELYHLYH